jgi:hypothetical protein
MMRKGEYENTQRINKEAEAGRYIEYHDFILERNGRKRGGVRNECENNSQQEYSTVSYRSIHFIDPFFLLADNERSLVPFLKRTARQKIRASRKH